MQSLKFTGKKKKEKRKKKNAHVEKKTCHRVGNHATSLSWLASSSSSSCVFSFLLKSSLLLPLLPIQHLFILSFSFFFKFLDREFGFNYSLITLFVGFWLYRGVLIPLWVTTLHVFDQFLRFITLNFFWVSFDLFSPQRNEEGGTIKIFVWNLFIWSTNLATVSHLHFWFLFWLSRQRSLRGSFLNFLSFMSFQLEFDSRILKCNRCFCLFLRSFHVPCSWFS